MSIRKGSSIIAGNIGQNVDNALSLNSDNPVRNSVITQALQNISLPLQNITNCITETPEDIKIEINSGVLTLKSGSKCYKPNGLDNSNLVFSNTTTSSDIVFTNVVSTDNGTFMLFLDNSGTQIYKFLVTHTSSGASYTSSAQVWVYYNTSENLIKHTTNNGTTWSGDLYLPFAVITVESGMVTSIQQIFNGMLFMGFTFFGLPGLKGLMPNGRSTDGSLINTTVELTNIIVRTSNITTAQGATFAYASNNPTYPGMCTDTGSERYIYDELANRYYATDNPSFNRMKLARVWSDGSRIVSMKPNYNFHSVDYNDTEFIAHQAMPSDKYIDLTVGASGTEYTAPADGYVYASGGNLNGCASSSVRYYDNFLPVRRGGTFILTYTNGTPSSFRFFYANGAV